MILIVLISVWAVMLVSVLSLRFSLLADKLALGLFALALTCSAIAAVVELIAFIRKGPSLGSGLYMLAFAFVPVVVLWMILPKAKAPLIHDVSTSPGKVEFVAGQNQRQSSHNSLALPEQSVVDQQVSAYPKIQALEMPGSKEQVFLKLKSQATAMGWNIYYEQSPDRFEAYDQTPLLGFKDDIAVVLTALGTDRVKIDVRSVSRIGKGDLGANAQRIQDFLEALQ